MTRTLIHEVKGRRVWDSRGRPTVEADIFLSGGARGRAIAPAGASKGRREAVELRDGGNRLGGYDVRNAVGHVNGEIRAALLGIDAVEQKIVDQALIDLDGTANKARLGANATIAVSMAVAHAACAAVNVPLWEFLSQGSAQQLPLPEVQIFGGGAHAYSRIDIQDFMVVAPAANSFAEAMEWTAEVYHAAGQLLRAEGKLQGVADEGGYWPTFASHDEAFAMLVRSIEKGGFIPGEEIGISIDVAASHLRRNGDYLLTLDGMALDSEGMCELVASWTERYPIFSVEDPLAEDDTAGMAKLTEAIGEQVQVVADDLVATDASRIRTLGAVGACNAALIKPNQVGTLTETRAALHAAREVGWQSIMSARSGESEDVTIVHLAVGWGIGQLKVGSFSRSERMAKWNEALRIEEGLGGESAFAGWGPLPQYRRRGVD